MVTEGIGRQASPEVLELTLKTAARLEELGHRVEHVEQPLPDSLADDFLLYWSMLAMVMVRTGRRTFGRSWDAGQLDNLTQGLAKHSARRLHKLPARDRPAAAQQPLVAYLFRAVRRRPHADPGHRDPRLGHLAPTSDYDTIMERLLDWVAFTPLQNATGDPAISLPLATTAAGVPHGMMFGAGAGREATLLELAYELEEAAPWPRIQDPSVG